MLQLLCMKVDLVSFIEEQLVRTTISIKLHKLKSRPGLFRPLTGVSIDDFDQVHNNVRFDGSS